MTNIEALKARLTLVSDPETLMLHRHCQSRTEDSEGNITGLNLCESDLTDAFLPILDQLPHLRALNLSGNPLLTKVALHPTLTALQWVDFSDCPELKYLQLPAAARLERLDTSDAPIKEIVLPEDLGRLQYLDLSRNQLEKLTLNGSLPLAEHIDLSGNKIENLKLSGITDRLKRLYLGDCSLAGVPDEIYKEKTNCAEALTTYFRAGASGMVLNAEAKVIFFGNQMAGKTTLSRQLRENIFEKIDEKDRTHGILIHEWEIPTANLPAAAQEKMARQLQQLHEEGHDAAQMPEHLLLYVWDFGGQEYFHATHRLFLNSNVLYLVVWETATNAQNATTGDYPYRYWIDNIAHYAPDHHLLYVQNKADKAAGFDENRGEYKVALRKEQEARSLMQYDLDVDSLKEGILARLSELKVVGETIPRVYEDIRQEIKRIKADTPSLSFTDFETLCRRIDTTDERIMQDDAQIRQVTNFLHDTGALICYRFREDKKSDKLNDYVFIHPRWVTDTIYAILDQEALDNKGELDKKHVISTLENRQNALNDANLWIDLMKEFELIFEKKDQQDHFIAPQYLPESCRDMSEKALNNLISELPHRVVLHYPDFLPRSVISRFICRYGNLAKDEFWKYGIVLHEDGEKIFVFCDYDTRNITLRSARRCSPLVLKAAATLRTIDNFPALAVGISEADRPDHIAGPVNWAKLQQEIAKGKDEIEQRDGHWIPLAPFRALMADADHAFHAKEGRAPERGDTENVLHSPQPVNKTSTTAKKAFFSYSKHDRAYLDDFLKALSALRRNGKIQPWEDSQLKPGEEWDDTIKQQLAEAEIIFLLLSNDFLATDYIWEVEIKAAMERYAKGEIRVVPIVLRPCDWKDLPFSGLNALPAKAKPVVDYPNKDTAWLEVVTGIKAILD